MAALLASFLALFVLVSAVDAAVCVPEAATAHASETVADAPSDPDGAGQPDQNAICAHCNCHYGGVTLPSAPDALTWTASDRGPAPPRPGDRLASRKPTGPDRPP